MTTWTELRNLYNVLEGLDVFDDEDACQPPTTREIRQRLLLARNALDDALSAFDRLSRE